MTTNDVFSGKVAFVTGGGTGIGRATAEQLARQGAKVVVAGRREEKLREVSAASAGSISYIAFDLAERSAHAAAMSTILQRHGRLDILVNNAAVQTTKLFIEHDASEIERNIDVNLTATALLTHAALPHLIASRGNIVNVTSAGGRYCGLPSGRISAYSAAKAGLNHLTRVLASELGEFGVRVNAVAPGLTDTEIAASAFEHAPVVQHLKSITALQRIGQPADVARVICFLASDAGGWVTGQVVDASGGFWLSA